MFDNSASVFSMVGFIIGAILVVAMFVWMRFCYFPGGYKKDEVMDLGDYAMFIAAQNHEKKMKEKEKYGDEYSDYTSYRGDDEEGDVYDEATPRTNNSGEAKDWYSVGTSEQDVEGGSSYFDERTASSPSIRSESDGRYETSLRTPSSLAPSTVPGRQGVRDDRSESTYRPTGTPQSNEGSGAYGAAPGSVYSYF